MSLIFGDLHLEAAGGQGVAVDGAGGDFIFNIDQEIIGFQSRPDKVRIRRIERPINSDEIHADNIGLATPKLKRKHIAVAGHLIHNHKVSAGPRHAIVNATIQRKPSPFRNADAIVIDAMGTREALIQEILRQPEPLLRELQHYLAYLVAHQENGEKKPFPSPAGAWPADYFQKTAGAFANEPFERPTQLSLEKREDWQT